MKPANPDPELLFHGGLAIPLELHQRLAWQENFNAWPAVRHFGMSLDLAHPVAVRFGLRELKPFHFGGVGDAANGGGAAVNGAIIAGLFDAALGVAGALQLPGRCAATVDISIKMFRPVMGEASAWGWAIKRTSSLVFVEAVVLDEDKRRCAQASGIVGAADAGKRAAPAPAPALASFAPELY
jgi:acyl-coenzyme A thioesterase PaaI-like protein